MGAGWQWSQQKRTWVKADPSEQKPEPSIWQRLASEVMGTAGADTPKGPSVNRIDPDRAKGVSKPFKP